MTRYDANQDGVLSFEEFKHLHNAAKDDAAGRGIKQRSVSPGRTVSGLSKEHQEARKKAAAESARKKAEESERIRKENAALKKRLQERLEAGGADAKALDAEFEARRRELAMEREGFAF